MSTPPSPAAPGAPQALDGRVALITGAARRIGRSVALRLAADGADIVFSYRHSKNEADSLVREIAALLVNNVGMFFGKPFEQLTETDWDTIMSTNLKSQFFMAQAAAPLLRASGRGAIVNFASLGGLLAWPNYVHYCVSKAGVIMLTRCLSRALAPEIRVNAIAPGTISFPDDAPGIAEDFIRRAPLARTGRPEDIAGAVSYLAQADFVTGQVLVVDGGRSIAS
jgi:NAD(P)-dependent dehydrogenase (short-subunit alcohol dehydrogenase family)